MKRFLSAIGAVLAALACATSCTKDFLPEQDPLENLSLSILPDYPDGSVYSCDNDGTFFLNIAVKPGERIRSFTNSGKFTYTAHFKRAMDKSIEDGENFSVPGEVTASFPDEGYMTLEFNLGEGAMALFLYDYSVSFTIDDQALRTVSTPSVPVSREDEPGFGGDEVVFTVYNTDVPDNHFTVKNLHSEDILIVGGRGANGKVAFDARSKTARSLFVYLEDGTKVKPVNTVYPGSNSRFFFLNISSDMAVYLGYERYQVSFDSNGHGTAPAPLSVEEGMTIPAPEAPVDAQYTFSGWYREPGCVNKWDFANDTVSTDITLYASWENDVDAGASVDGWEKIGPDIPVIIGD
ncbi:MAG: InlB B-repeat-containing protein [Bacteroidales bacterium]|nr:InlB B-repeat-containing protein [Bacteroidales bacterium]